VNLDNMLHALMRAGVCTLLSGLAQLTAWLCQACTEGGTL
jgi:hypothetical protein